MAQNHRVNYYTNPAFCQQSEFYQDPPPAVKPNLVRCSSMREAPIGANSPQKFERFSSMRNCQKNRYEPPPMDENELKINQQVINELKMEEMNITKNRYAYLPQSADNKTRTISPPPVYQPEPHSSMPSGRVHRYATIPTDDEDEEDNEDEEGVNCEEQIQIREMSPNRVHYNNNRQKMTILEMDHNGNTPPKNRYTPVPAPRTIITPKNTPINNNRTPNITSPVTPKKNNPIATQKLHELLSTPRKTPQRSNSVMVTPKKHHQMSPPMQSSTPKRVKSPPPSYPTSPIRNQQLTPQRVPYYVSPPQYMLPNGPYPQNYPINVRKNSSGIVLSPKAQQKLQYPLPVHINGRYNLTVNPMENHRNTAIIQPIRNRSPPPQSVYSETTLSASKSSSWMNLSQKLKDNSNATLAVAALMMILCGALTSGFGFYMISLVGRRYYLDFALVSGFTCFILGLLGFRTRTCRWLPNRNYISGYIVLSVFSLLTCAGLLVLLGLRPKPGSPLADVTSGAVCGISALSLLLASLGVLTSYCCKYPPPDNRVEHCAPGFTV